MKKITGLFIMMTLAFAGVMGITYLDKKQKADEAALSNLKTKLQKTLVLIEGTNLVEKKNLKTQIAQTQNKPKAKASVSHTRAKIFRETKSFSQRKSDVLASMNQAFSSLLSVRHIFRHEITEMIDIIKKSKVSQSRDRKIIYAKNWSKYVKRNIKKFNMNEESRNLVKTMANKMSRFIDNIDKPVVSSFRTELAPLKKVVSKLRTIKAARVIDISSVSPKRSNSIQARLMRKSVAESLAAIKDLESSRKTNLSLSNLLTFAWLLACALFAIIAVWMSKAKFEKVVESVIDDVTTQETQDEIVVAIPDIPEHQNDDIPLVPQFVQEPEVPEIRNRTLIESVGTLELLAINSDSDEYKEDEVFFFDDIVNNLSNLCQAKGVMVNTENVNNIEDKIHKFNLANIGDEIEGFIKTVIRSFGRDSEKEIKIHLKDADKKVKIIAAVSGDSSFDINMKKIASGFRELEEKLASRKGVFNIDQDVLGNDINFIMQVAADQVKSEDENVEKTKNDQGGSITV